MLDRTALKIPHIIARLESPLGIEEVESINDEEDGELKEEKYSSSGTRFAPNSAKEKRLNQVLNNCFTRTHHVKFA